jgi:hypothetical protein
MTKHTHNLFHRLITPAAIALGVGLPMVAMAATSDTVTLGGTVTSTVSVDATDTAEASTLDLTTASEQIVKVADIAMTTNNSTGLTLTASSGNLSNPDAETIAFAVTSVTDAAAAPASGAFTVPSGTNYTVANAEAGSFDEDLYIAYTPASLQDPGVYSGTISLTIADN